MGVSLKIATWNVENLFRPDSGAGSEEQEAYRRKLHLLAGTIGRLQPDVIALQEIGGEEALLDLQQALGADYAQRQLSVFPDARGIRVAFLSRLPLLEHEDIVEFPPGPALHVFELDATGATAPLTRMGRGALRVRVEKDGLAVDLITAHLKSKLLTFPGTGATPQFTPRTETERAQVAGIALLRRTAEAVTLRIAANTFLVGNRDRPLILLGDLNDVPEAATSQILNGPPGSEIGTAGFDRPDQGDDARLFNLAPLIPEARRFSRVFKGQGELIDQILVSEELLPIGQNGKRKLPVEVDSHIDFAGQLSSITEDPGLRRKAPAPDHAPVTVTFDL
jgi:predicted extracellular nuclease